MNPNSNSNTQQPSRKPSFNRSRRNNGKSSQPGTTQGSKPQFGKGKSRYAQKKNRRPVAAPKPRGPVKEYVSACCSLPAIKPRCGQLEAVINPETKKSKEMPKGLGHWRCTGCRKVTKVRPQAPTPKEAVVVAA